MEKVKDRKRKDNGERAEQEPASFKVQDRRHWATPDESDDEGEEAGVPSTQPTIVDEYRQRAEAAEAKLLEYIEAHKRFREEQEQVRQRLTRDVDRRVEQTFGSLLQDLLATVDDLDLALSHVDGVPEAKPLADGVAMARDRFLAALGRQGVEPLDPAGQEFDPTEADAMHVEPVDDPAADGKVLRTLQAGYRLGEHVIRPARVVVGKHGG